MDSKFLLIQILVSGLLSLKFQIYFKFPNAKMLANTLLKTASKLIVQKLRNMNLFMNHAFFPLLFSNLIYFELYINIERQCNENSLLPHLNLFYESHAHKPVNPTLIQY